MINIIDKKNCCGCHACFSICPKNAIKMEEDEYGFEYPKIDEKLCINCGLCEKVCPVVNTKENKYKIKAYACYNKNMEERLNSSSGGIFILIAKEIIKNNGVVFGAAFNPDFSVSHTYATTEEDLKKFMTSKYVQSKIGNSYKIVKKFLDQNKLVLFTGTSCQIEGLKAYLKKDYKNLITQDIICHGVPSPKVWKKYLDYQENINKESIKSISFRNKDHGWSLYRMKISFDTRTYSKEHPKDMFMQVFLKNVCLRDSCYSCSFKKMYRNSDITLADYWGINNVHPGFNKDNKGTSLLLLNSEKGLEIFKKIKHNLNYTETDLINAISYNKSYIKSVELNKKRDKFFAKLDKVNFNKLTKKYTKKSLIKKIKIKFNTLLKFTIRNKH